MQPHHPRVGVLGPLLRLFLLVDQVVGVLRPLTLQQAAANKWGIEQRCGSGLCLSVSGLNSAADPDYGDPYAVKFKLKQILILVRK